MEATERLSLPFIVPGQAQKELAHNEALLRLDAIVAAAVEEEARDDPPPSPTAGATYLIGEAPTGEWAGRADHLAAFSSGGWRYIAPVVGLSIFVKTSGAIAIYQSSGWELGTLRGSRLEIGGKQVVGTQTASITAPSGGGTVDLEARSSISQILTALRQHGLIAAS
jgi:hypothetical protein